MSEFFLELFSEEIPAGLQKKLRKKILDDFRNFFDEKLVKSKKSFSSSSPNRLVVVFEGLDKSIQIKSEEIRGPKIGAPEQAIEGFIRSNKIEKKHELNKYEWQKPHKPNLTGTDSAYYPNKNKNVIKKKYKSWKD